MKRGKPPQPPAVRLDMAKLVKQEPFIRHMLREFRVPDVDADDLVQLVLLGAWRSSEAGRFRPEPGKPLRRALRSWLIGIAFNVATHHHARAYRRREILAAEPYVLADEIDDSPGALDLLLAHERYRAFLEAFCAMPAELRAAIQALAAERSIADFAEDADLKPGTAYSVVRRARAELRARIARAEAVERWAARRRR